MQWRVHMYCVNNWVGGSNKYGFGREVVRVRVRVRVWVWVRVLRW